MRSSNYVIVELKDAYSNEQEISTGDSFIVNSTIEDVSYINRVAKVLVAPPFTILQEGDEVITHHNIFRLRNDVNGNIAQSNYHLDGDKYFIPLTELFMYRRGGGDWVAIEPYCFVKPIEQAKEDSFFDMSLEDDSYKGMVSRHGIISYPNKGLIEQGIEAGDTIIFSEYSEYEFYIEGELYYKMSTKDIIGKI
tara:strand:- start:138 stop:719 length:582 start_codon:yes stop_codon:yes gene_type:complete